MDAKARPTKNSTIKNNEPTEYPPSFPKPLKEVVALYFALVDSPSPDAGERLATEVFTPSGCLVTPKASFEGSEGKSLLHGTHVCFLQERAVLTPDS